MFSNGTLTISKETTSNISEMSSNQWKYDSKQLLKDTIGSLPARKAMYTSTIIQEDTLCSHYDDQKVTEEDHGTDSPLLILV